MDHSAPDLSAYAQDAELSSAEAGNILAQITNTVRELREAQADVASCEAMLKAAQERVRGLTEMTLPQLMDEAKQRELVTSDGWRVTRSEAVRAGISADNMPAAVAWLNAHGAGSIVKHEVTLRFGKGEEQRQAEALGVLREHHFAPSDKMSVHPQTLGALVREKLAEGVELPLELLGIYIQPIIRLKPA
jgi:hypothetical protein